MGHKALKPGDFFGPGEKEKLRFVQCCYECVRVVAVARFLPAKIRLGNNQLPELMMFTQEKSAFGLVTVVSGATAGGRANDLVMSKKYDSTVKITSKSNV